MNLLYRHGALILLLKAIALMSFQETQGSQTTYEDGSAWNKSNSWIENTYHISFAGGSDPFHRVALQKGPEKTPHQVFETATPVTTLPLASQLLLNPSAILGGFMATAYACKVPIAAILQHRWVYTGCAAACLATTAYYYRKKSRLLAEYQNLQATIIRGAMGKPHTDLIEWGENSTPALQGLISNSTAMPASTPTPDAYNKNGQKPRHALRWTGVQELAACGLLGVSTAVTIGLICYTRSPYSPPPPPPGHR